MQILAKVLHRLEKKSGTSKTSGKDWASIEFVVEYDFDQKYPKKAILQFFGVEQVNQAIQAYTRAPKPTSISTSMQASTTANGSRNYAATNTSWQPSICSQAHQRLNQQPRRVRRCQ